jgi:small-conductance mechanosensitive channel
MKIFIKSLILFSLLSGFCVLANAQQEGEKTAVGESSSVSEKGQDELKDVKEEVKDVKSEVEAIKKEVKVQERALELEKKKAEIEVKEAETAKKEAAITEKITKDKAEVEKVVKKVKKEEKEAQAALKKAEVAEEKMSITLEKAKLIEEELILVRERANIAETKLKEKQRVLYGKLFQTGIIIFIGYLLIFIAISIVNRRVKDLKVKHIVRKNIVYLCNFLIILAIILVWLEDIGSVTVIFSVIGAGLVLALQDAILSIAGWFLILVRRPFVVGDRVEFGGVKGDVIDIRLFQTTLLEMGNWVEADQSTGRIVNIPNSAVFRKEDYNYNRGFEFIWNEIKVFVTFESDWKRAEEIMLKHGAKIVEGMEEVVKRKISYMTKEYMIYYDKLTPFVYVDIKDSGVELSLRYLTEAKNRRVTHDALCRAILDDFEKEEKVNFAYRTYRIVK